MEDKTLFPIREEELGIREEFGIVSDIVSVNIENIRQVVHIYDEFLFLLQEQSRVTIPFIELQ